MVPSPMRDQLGRVVGGRYRLIAQLGIGSSAQVFLAEDTTLGRQVAIKMLQPALASDAQFLQRFQLEARAVASFSHPNVVVVHDSGVDEVPYIVTEFLAGGSLRAIIAAGTRLTPSQALLVGLDACRGLAHAHGKGLVHRDLKPANLLFGEDGRLRIADFGVARALAETGVTEHEGSLVGTLRYVAPEQARGVHVGAKADVYSLALCMIEAVTGLVPFAGPDPVSSLQARTMGDLVVPDALGPLRPALERAGRLDPDQRTDAEELAIALLAASEQLPAPAPIPLVGALAEAASSVPEHDPTQHSVSTVPSVVGPLGEDDGDGEGAAGSGGAGDGARRRRWPKVVASVVASVLLVAGAVVAYRTLQTPSYAVPVVAGQQLEALELVAESHEWTLDVKRTRVDGTEPGEIVSTDPPSGERLEEGGTLIVLVSEGNELTDVPQDLAGRTLEEAAALLEQAGLGHRDVEVFHEEVPAGSVIGFDGEVEPRVARETEVPLLVSKGPEPRTVPDFDPADSYDAIAAALSELGLVATRVEVFSDDAPAGVVMGVEPGPGTRVPRDSTVAVTVSKGPDLVVVPDLRGMTLSQAVAKLEQAGLVLGQDCCSSRGKVVGSDPASGTKVRRGTAVNLFLVR